MTEARGRLKVLLSAFACEPGQGSESGVGWHWALQAAREHEVWVLACTGAREAIEREVSARGLTHLHFVYYDLPSWLLRVVPERLRYLLWQLGVLAVARRLQREVGFDVVHHVTFNTLEVPGLLWALGPPFVWGPVGGGQVPPKALQAYFRTWWPVEVVRGLRKRFVGLNPLVRLAARRANCILVANEDTAARLRGLGAGRLLPELETASELPERAVEKRRDGVFTIVWAGRLVPRKGPLLALDVAAALRTLGVDFRLVMAGDGPWEGLLRKQIAALGLEGVVEMTGRVDFGAMAGLYARGDVFLFTSLQDTSGNVVLEAMAAGLPVVALDHQGVGEILTPNCGVKVPVESQRQVVDGMARALQTLALDPERRARLGDGARLRIAERYTWDRKGELLSRLYAEVARATRHDVPVVETVLTAR